MLWSIVIDYATSCSYYICPSSSQHWSKISKPVDRSVQWPEGRVGHAATCVSGSVLLIVGGWDRNICDECWISDTTTTIWKKV